MVWQWILGGLATVFASALTAWGVIYAARRADQTSRESALLQLEAEPLRVEADREKNAVDGFEALSTSLSARVDQQDAKILRQDDLLTKQAETIRKQSRRIDEVEKQAEKAKDEAARTHHGLDVAIRFVSHLIAMWPATHPIPVVPAELRDMIDATKPATVTPPPQESA